MCEVASWAQRERWYRERSSIKARRFGLVSTEFRDVFFESNLGEQRGDLRAKTSCSSILFIYSISENVPDFFLHAPSMPRCAPWTEQDRKSTRLNSSHVAISYAVFCLKKKSTTQHITRPAIHVDN